MSRRRCAVAAVCLAAVLFATLPGAVAAQRGAEQLSAISLAGPPGEGLVDSLRGWTRSAFAWLRAITAAEHGQVAERPVAPPPIP